MVEADIVIAKIMSLQDKFRDFKPLLKKDNFSLRGKLKVMFLNFA